MKTGTINISDLEQYFKLVRVERDFMHRLHRVKELSEQKLKLLEEAKLDAQYLRNFVGTGSLSNVLDQETKKEIRRVLLLNLKTERVRNEVKEATK